MIDYSLTLFARYCIATGLIGAVAGFAWGYIAGCRRSGNYVTGGEREQ